MPFGLANAPDRLKRALKVILPRFRCNTFLVYFHDVIMFLITVYYYIAHLEELFININGSLRNVEDQYIPLLSRKSLTYWSYGEAWMLRY